MSFTIADLLAKHRPPQTQSHEPEVRYCAKTQKVRYDRAGAKRQLAVLYQADHEVMNAYRCFYCGDWHTGHTDR